MVYFDSCKLKEMREPHSFVCLLSSFQRPSRNARNE